MLQRAGVMMEAENWSVVRPAMPPWRQEQICRKGGIPAPPSPALKRIWTNELQRGFATGICTGNAAGATNPMERRLFGENAALVFRKEKAGLSLVARAS
jgi:hypothetical protein